MRKKILKAVLSSAALLWFAAPVRAEDRAVTPISEAPQGIQVSVVDGKLVVTNSAPNRPVVVSKSGAVVDAQEDIDEIHAQMPANIQSLVNSISKTHGVDPRLVAAVMKVESNYNRWARSSKGALGLMQLIPATGKRFGVEDFFDPAQNIEGGVRYLKFLSDKFGAHNLDLQLAAYNAGENLVERLGRVPSIRETVDYVRKIKTIYKPEVSPGLVSASDGTEPATSPALSSPNPAVIYSNVDERGVVRFSNIGPPN
jgi:soluble lytic murein transglycosylase-like protein